MLSINLQNILNNRLRYLPEITGKAINSIDWPAKVIEIGHKHGLHMEDIQDLQEVVLKSMVGLASPESFESNIITATATSPATAEKIIEELNHEIFEPIHDYVMSGGKAPDPLKTSGIELSSDDAIPDALPVPPKKDSTLLEIPASPKTEAVKPQVTGDFSDFFIATPTKTDHSMLK